MDKDIKVNEIVTENDVPINNNETNVLYYPPKFTHRVFANLLDILIFVFVFFSCFLATREIIRATPDYQNKSAQLTQIKLDTGIYDYDDDNILRDIVSVLNNDKGQTAKSRAVRSRKAIETFIGYVEANSTNEMYVQIVNDYRSYRLADSMKHNDVPMFVIDENNEVVENPALVESVESVSSQVFVAYYEKAYQPYIDNRVQAYLVTAIPTYSQIIKYQTNLLLWVNIFAVYCFSGLLVYLVPPLIFRRGRMTLGKFLYGIGLIDSECLCPSIPRFLARFAIFYFSVLVLSLFTFGIPMIISTSLMIFSKNKQGFPDYMLGLREIDAKRTKIYFSFKEVELEKINIDKKPIEFTPRHFD